MPGSNPALTTLADALRRHRNRRATRWRKLSADRQALLIVAYLRKGETHSDLAGGFQVGDATSGAPTWCIARNICHVLSEPAGGSYESIATRRVASVNEDRSCFVIMPIRAQGSPEYVQYRALYDTIIRPPLIELGYNVIRADDVTKAGAINSDVIHRLANAELVVADLTSLNPNVFYELGIRHALRRHGTILIVNSSETSVPFDLKAYRVIEFSADLLGYEKLRETLFRFASALASDQEPPARDSPVHDVLPSLPYDIFALAEGSTEGKLREQISDLQGQLRRYAEKFGPGQLSLRDTANEILARTLDLARRGELPADVFRKARESVRDGSPLEFLTLLSQLMDPYAAGSITVQQWLQLSIDATSLGLPEVAGALNLRAMEQRPNDPTLKSVYYSGLAHSEDPRQREQARTELRALMEIADDGNEAHVGNHRRELLLVLGPMLDAYQRDGLREEALRITTAIIKIAPHSSLVLRNHARALDDVGRLNEALDCYKRASSARDANATTAKWFGNFLHVQERLEASCLAKARACRLAPEDGDNYAQLADEIGDVLTARLASGFVGDDAGGTFSGATVSRIVVCALSCRQLTPETLEKVRQVIEAVDLDEDLINRLLAARRGAPDGGTLLLSKNQRLKLVDEIVNNLEADATVQKQLDETIPD